MGQLSLEAGVMGAISALMGIGLALVALRFMSGALAEAPFWVSFDATPRTLTFSVVLALLITAVCGVAPALKATRHDVRSVLSGSEFSMSRFGAIMMVGQMALSIALLSGALVMAQSLWSAAGQELDLPDNQVLTAQITRPAETTTEPAPKTVAEAISEMSGVLASGTSDHLPRYDAPAVTVEIAGAEPNNEGLATRSIVSPGYLESLEARLLAGRLLNVGDYSVLKRTETNITGANVAVVNEPFVRRFFAEDNPIGQAVPANRATRGTTVD